MLSVRFEMLHNTDKFERSRKREKKKGVDENEVFFCCCYIIFCF